MGKMEEEGLDELRKKNDWRFKEEVGEGWDDGGDDVGKGMVWRSMVVG